MSHGLMTLMLLMAASTAMATACGDEGGRPAAQATTAAPAWGPVVQLEMPGTWTWPDRLGIVPLEGRKMLLLRGTSKGVQGPYQVSLIDAAGAQIWGREFSINCHYRRAVLAANGAGVTIAESNLDNDGCSAMVRRLTLDGKDVCDVGVPNNDSPVFSTVAGGESWVIAIGDKTEGKKFRIYRVGADCVLNSGTLLQDVGLQTARPVGLVKVLDGWIALFVGDDGSGGQPDDTVAAWAAVGVGSAGTVQWRLAGKFPDQFNYDVQKVALTARDGSAAYLTAFSGNLAKSELLRWVVTSSGFEQLKPLIFSRSLGKYGGNGAFVGADGATAASISFPTGTGYCYPMVGWALAGTQAVTRQSVAVDAFLRYAGQAGDSWAYLWQWDGSSQGKAWLQWGPAPSSNGGNLVVNDASKYGCP